jgi:hypothetical protein
MTEAGIRTLSVSLTNSNFQSTSSKQSQLKRSPIASSGWLQNEGIVLNIGYWDFEFVCDLRFVIWCLRWRCAVSAKLSSHCHLAFKNEGSVLLWTS